ncbi:thiamine-phosphate kinase [bacterium SCSIO 12696]|nr:thiamine-phosphate kinase [bacterium SCSIO 12696]
MSEFSLIRRYFSNLQTLSEGVALGIGDDGAVVEHRPDEQLVVATDTLVEGVHFPQGLTPEYIASRALGSNLSDLAAMGAEPRWFTLALTLPEEDANWLASFSDGLAAMARRYHCSLVGGDTTRGPLVVTITVHGVAPKGQALTPSGARPGDKLFVSGLPGLAAAGLACLQNRFTPGSGPLRDCAVARFTNPQPRLALGEQLRGIASAAIDVSDGLLADLNHICQRSGVGAELDIAALEQMPWPASGNYRQRLFDWALHGGDDYELCFAVPVEKLASLAELDSDCEITEIGECVAGGDIVARDTDGVKTVMAPRGFQHF